MVFFSGAMALRRPCLYCIAPVLRVHLQTNLGWAAVRRRVEVEGRMVPGFRMGRSSTSTLPEMRGAIVRNGAIEVSFRGAQMCTPCRIQELIAMGGRWGYCCAHSSSSLNLRFLPGMERMGSALSGWVVRFRDGSAASFSSI